MSKFIVFEGGEGAGKSTQLAILADRLRAAGTDVLVTREPGGTPFAECVRSVLLDPDTPARVPLAEALLFYAARADHIEAVIKPALHSGKWVLCDRFSLSTWAYQVAAGGLPTVDFRALERLVVGGCIPHMTLVFDVPVDVGLERARARRLGSAADAYEQRDVVFHSKLRAAYTSAVNSGTRPYMAIDGTQSLEVIADQVWTCVDRLAALKA